MCVCWGCVSLRTLARKEVKYPLSQTRLLVVSWLGRVGFSRQQWKDLLLNNPPSPFVSFPASQFHSQPGSFPFKDSATFMSLVVITPEVSSPTVDTFDCPCEWTAFYIILDERQRGKSPLDDWGPTLSRAKVEFWDRIASHPLQRKAFL